MARPKSTTKSTVDAVAVENTTATVSNKTVEQATTPVVENINEKEEIKIETKKAEPLMDSDEIEVISLIPNVSYKDNHTGDFYEWDVVGHSEYMTFETLKNMWRNNKGYFRNMWLKPNDDRVINKFGLTNTFKKYDFLMDESNYTRANIDKLCKDISDSPNGLKNALYTKIKDFVIRGKVTDVVVIRALEKHLKVDLISFL